MADKKPKKLADLRDQKQDLQSQDVSGLTNAAFAKRIKECLFWWTSVSFGLFMSLATFYAKIST